MKRQAISAINAAYLGKVEEEVPRGLNGRFGPTGFAPRLLQLHSVDQLAAFVALITASVLVAAERTNAFHKAIRKKPEERQRKRGKERT